MPDWVYLIGFFVLIGIVMAVVGFIGNKMSDGVENALRARKHRNQPERKSESASLSERYQAER